MSVGPTGNALPTTDSVQKFRVAKVAKNPSNFCFPLFLVMLSSATRRTHAHAAMLNCSFRDCRLHHRRRLSAVQQIFRRARAEIRSADCLKQTFGFVQSRRHRPSTSRRIASRQLAKAHHRRRPCPLRRSSKPHAYRELRYRHAVSACFHRDIEQRCDLRWGRAQAISNLPTLRRPDPA